MRSALMNPDVIEINGRCRAFHVWLNINDGTGVMIGLPLTLSVGIYRNVDAGINEVKCIFYCRILSCRMQNVFLRVKD